jgi:hypothetical protein
MGESLPQMAPPRIKSGFRVERESRERKLVAPVGSPLAFATQPRAPLFPGWVCAPYFEDSFGLPTVGAPVAAPGPALFPMAFTTLTD